MSHNINIDINNDKTISTNNAINICPIVFRIGLTYKHHCKIEPISPKIAPLAPTDTV